MNTKDFPLMPTIRIEAGLRVSTDARAGDWLHGVVQNLIDGNGLGDTVVAVREEGPDDLVTYVLTDKQDVLNRNRLAQARIDAYEPVHWSAPGIEDPQPMPIPDGIVGAQLRWIYRCGSQPGDTRERFFLFRGDTYLKEVDLVEKRWPGTKAKLGR
jgi:hypothetical protein